MEVPLWGNSTFSKLVKAKDASVLLVDEIWATHEVQCVTYSKSSSVELMKLQQVKKWKCLIRSHKSAEELSKLQMLMPCGGEFQVKNFWY